MTSQAIRDPLADHLITPQNAALEASPPLDRWARVETVPATVEIVLTDRLLKE
jgi:hypothetical protein